MDNKGKGFILALGIVLFCIHAVGYSADMARSSSELKIPSELLTGKNVRLDPSFFVTPDMVMQRMDANDVIVVDVRRPEEFETFRIPGSINIALFAVKTRSMLAGKAVVLVNEGYRYLRLERECKKLRKAGFDISILAGGLNRWRRAGGRIEGDPFAIRTLNRMPANVLFEEKDCANWVFVDAAPKNEPALSKLMPYAKAIPFSGGGIGFAAELKKIMSGKNPLTFVAIAGTDGKGYSAMESVLSKGKVKDVFFVQGGAAAYRRFLENQTRMWEQADRRRVTVEKCSRCP